MKKRTLIIILGIWIAIVPILGLPNSWKNNINIVSGLAVAFFAATRRKSLRSTGSLGSLSQEQAPEVADEIIKTETIEVVEIVGKPEPVAVEEIAVVIPQTHAQITSDDENAIEENYIVPSASYVPVEVPKSSAAIPTVQASTKPKRVYKARAPRLKKAERSTPIASSVIVDESISVQ